MVSIKRLRNQIRAEIKNFIRQQFESPSEDFIRFLLSSVDEEGDIQKADIQLLTDTVKQALKQFLNEQQAQPTQQRAIVDKPPPTDGKMTQRKKKGPNTRLIVTFPNNEVIFHRYASVTFLNVIKRLGIERVKNIMPNLLSDTKLDGYTKLGSYYVYLQTNTKQKKDQLDKIASHLAIKLRVTITKAYPLPR